MFLRNVTVTAITVVYGGRMSVGRKLKKWRMAKGLSERAAAREVGVSQPTWCAAEGDEFKRMGVDIVARFVDACGVDFRDFCRR